MRRGVVWCGEVCGEVWYGVEPTSLLLRCSLRGCTCSSPSRTSVSAMSVPVLQSRLTNSWEGREGRGRGKGKEGEGEVEGRGGGGGGGRREAEKRQGMRKACGNFTQADSSYPMATAQSHTIANIIKDCPLATSATVKGNWFP